MREKYTIIVYKIILINDKNKYYLIMNIHINDSELMDDDISINSNTSRYIDYIQRDSDLFNSYNNSITFIVLNGFKYFLFF